MPARSMTKGGIEGVGCLAAAVSGADEIYGGGGDESFVKNKVAAAFKAEEPEVVGSNGSAKKRPPCTTTRDLRCSNDESPSSSSSIGKNSDLSEDDDSSEKKSAGEEEVQSSYKGPLDAMEALEQVLPIRRGISRFYNGKSKSFASLADAPSSSPASSTLAKPENAYARKRRNLLACSLAYDRPRASPLRGNSGGGISKRANSNTSKTTLALAVAMTGEDKQPPLMVSSAASPPVKAFSSWRSFSMVDLQQN